MTLRLCVLLAACGDLGGRPVGNSEARQVAVARVSPGVTHDASRDHMDIQLTSVATLDSQSTLALEVQSKPKEAREHRRFSTGPAFPLISVPLFVPTPIFGARPLRAKDGEVWLSTTGGFVMNKSDQERSDADETHPQPLIYEEPFSSQVTLGRMALGALAVMISVGGAIFWANRSRTLISGDEAQNHQSVTLAALPQKPMQPIDIQRLPVGAQKSVQPGPTPVAQTPLLEAPALVKERMSVSFFEPNEGTLVGSTWLVRGMAKGVPEDKHLWLVTRREPEMGFWPRERLTLGTDGAFEQQIWDHGSRGPVSICLLATSVVDTLRFNEWLLAGDRDDVWPTLHQVEGRSTMLGCQDVQMDPNVRQ